MTWHTEYTDTFSGEANYSWVKRKDWGTEPPTVRQAKKWAGINGVPAVTIDYGDTIEIKPRGMATVLFIMWRDE
jgi:hypothetical protein